MAKQGMKRPDRPENHPKNEGFVPEIQGKAKNDKKDANPIISDTSGPGQKVFHTERPISKAYKEVDNDLARDNMENDLPESDLQDL